jgi:Amidohydrolase family
VKGLLVGTYAIVFCILAAQNATGSPASPTYAFVNAYWWNGVNYRLHTFYAVAGVLRTTKPVAVDETIDLEKRYVIPPLAEGHNHWLEPARVAEYNACYLADGVFYVRDMRNLPFVVDQIRDAVNLPTSVDFVTALQGFTGVHAHPVEIIDYFVHTGVFPADWKRDYDPEAEFVVQTLKDVDDRMRLLVPEHPAYVKAYLSYSELYEERRNDPKMDGNHRSMDPKFLPHLVHVAHAAGLKVAVHVYTAFDFRVALKAGADDIAHLPSNGSEVGYGIEKFQLTAADAELAKRRGVRVTTTVQGIMDFDDPAQGEWNRVARDRAVIPNLRLLKGHGVQLLVGSDEFRHSPLHEILALRDLGVFTNAEILNMDTLDTARATFPDRKIGRLAEGYEANFLVLARDPTENLDNLKSIFLRVKQGRRLTVPAWALNRPSLSCVIDDGRNKVGGT